MTAGRRLKGAAFFFHIRQEYADRQQIVIRMRVKRPILTPINRHPAVGRFDIELGVIETNRRTDKLS